MCRVKNVVNGDFNYTLFSKFGQRPLLSPIWGVCVCVWGVGWWACVGMHVCIWRECVLVALSRLAFLLSYVTAASPPCRHAMIHRPTGKLCPLVLWIYDLAKTNIFLHLNKDTEYWHKNSKNIQATHWFLHFVISTENKNAWDRPKGWVG